jgi:hypothetical protein
MKTLLFILGDQLSRSLSSPKTCPIEDTVVLMAEVQEEAAYAGASASAASFLNSLKSSMAAG